MIAFEVVLEGDEEVCQLDKKKKIVRGKGINQRDQHVQKCKPVCTRRSW